jgi:putative transposase
MLRSPTRASAPDVYHVVHKSRTRCASLCQPPSLFRSPSDYIRYQDDLQDALLRLGIFCHAFAQLPGQVHLLVTPGSSLAIDRLMEQMQQRYPGQLARAALARSDYCAAAIGSDQRCWQAYRYIEYAPVRAGLAACPEAWYWSSYAHNALAVPCELITAHPLYLALAPEPAARPPIYRGLLAQRAAQRRHCQRLVPQVDNYLTQKPFWGRIP